MTVSTAVMVVGVDVPLVAGGVVDGKRKTGMRGRRWQG